MVPTAGYEPLLWTGDATDTSTSTNPDTITMDAAKTVGATFNLLPTFVSAEMTTTTNVDLTLAENITIGSGGSGGIVVTGSVTGASNATYASGDTTPILSYTTADPFQAGETITIDYTQPTDGLEDSNGGDLASFSGESVTNSISGGSSYLFEWAAENLTAETYDATDGGTITVASSGTPSYSFETGYANNAIQLNTGTWCYAIASDTHNINASAGTISFRFKLVSGTSSNAHRLISWGNTDAELDLKRSSAGETRYGIGVAGTNYYHDTTENLYDGNWHLVVLDWNCPAQTYSFSLDGSSYSGSLATTDTPTPGNNRLYYNGYNDTTSALQDQYDTVTVE
jgi:hypothetical protein